MEIEKKYLIREMPDLSNYKKHEIEQGYLCRKPVLRIRKKDEKYIFTFKAKMNGRSEDIAMNDEVERDLTKEAYESLRNKIDGKLIYKTRYIIPISATYREDVIKKEGRPSINQQNETYPSELFIELDLFHGCLEGLVFAEIEFPNEEAAMSFVPPIWFGKDVSSDKRYRNGFLSEQNDLSAFQ